MVENGVFFGGLAIAATGLWMYRPWVALVVAGGVLMWLGYQGVLSKLEARAAKKKEGG